MNDSTGSTQARRGTDQRKRTTALAKERARREALEAKLRATEAVLADALAGNAGDLYSVQLSDENEEHEPDELLVRARTPGAALAALEGHCRLRADGWEERTFTVKLWRVKDGAGVLGFDDLGEFTLQVETLCARCGKSEAEHKTSAECSGYELGTEQRFR